MKWSQPFVIMSNDQACPSEDLEDLYENAPCGYLSMQQDGRIFKANKTLATWLGYPAGELVGVRFHDLLTIGTRIFFETHYAPLLAVHGRFDEVSFDLHTKQGESLPVFASGIERRDASGRLQFTRLIVFKAAERRLYEQQLVEARKAADAAREQSQTLEALTQELLIAERNTAKLREQFIAILGHDLRNPLASIGGGVELLLKEPISERGVRLLTMVQASVRRMAGLIDNVLDFARGRMGGGIAIENRTTLLLAPLLEQLVTELQIAFPDHFIETHIDLREPISCDPSRLGQLVSNLLGNAFTHGSRAEPVRLYANKTAEVVEISVANGGAPIPTAALERLFQPFFRGEVRLSQQGLGLGLHIASEIAKAHGGTLTVESSPSETRFTFRMPQFVRADTPAA